MANFFVASPQCIQRIRFRRRVSKLFHYFASKFDEMCETEDVAQTHVFSNLLQDMWGLQGKYVRIVRCDRVK